jgi:glycosyltransferase involved in cell wall biosynthesis
MSTPGPGGARPRLAVVVCTRDRPQQLGETLVALRAAVDPDDELLVVDSASVTDETVDVATAAGYRVVRAARPGLSVARNIGLAETAAELIAFTDDDCVPRPGWTVALATAFADPKVGVVTGRLVAASGGNQLTVDLGDAFAFDATSDPAEVGAGACMAFRRAAIEGVGGFDEALGAGTPLRSGEDHDAFWRVVRAGWTGWHEPGAAVEHRDWRSRTDLVRMGWAYGLGAGAVAMKAARVDPATGWSLMRKRVVRDGFGKSVRFLAKGWERPALTCLLYAAGATFGAARTYRRPLTKGLLAACPRQDLKDH